MTGFPLGVVVPTCDRRDNLALLFSSLGRQTGRDFHVVVADDGSTDGTRSMVDTLAASDPWRGRLSWIGCGPNFAVRSGRARNIGVANLPEDTSAVIFLDSDLVVQPTALETFADLHRRHPDSVIIGAVDWLPPAPRAEVAESLDDLPTLRRLVPETQPRRIGGTFVGPELRQGLFAPGTSDPVPLRPEWSLSLNIAWPIDGFWRVGGFDEAMTGYGYEDNELGARAAAAGIGCVATAELWALHVWHGKPDTAMAQNQANLDYYLRRHGPNPLMETDIDWRRWFHYHVERGGTVVRFGSTVWALDASRRHRLALPDPGHLRLLGHRKDRLNHIKQRENYRPIAPAARIEDLATAFDADFEDPYMLYFRRVRDRRLAAVTHVDGSARVQTVARNTNPLLHRLLGAVAERQGLGVVCNTSLNFNGHGFINRISDLVAYCESRGVTDMVVGTDWYEGTPGLSVQGRP
ncbi:MAG: carbamoyltransferase C-terminal domain-containing protein [Pseudonocardiaceae bacterium]